ncbi:MAG TPA: polymer-forming cytoskeletal protein [Terriglobales bacterium]|jgi:cytoskeletal protein CcmA (bactofilin family)|nr:polymer-forming cytoskeletal protein [Terriglobales bacterium]
MKIPALRHLVNTSEEAEFMEMPKTTEFAHIGKSVIIKGELSGSEDLYVDGQVEGSIELSGNRLIIGPHGQVRARVNAKGVIVQGKLEGNIQAGERVELTKSAILVGDIATQRVAIEEGAYFKGKVDIQREGARTEAAKAAPVASASAAAGSSSAGASSVMAKSAVTEGK